jgi:hypothetical protein
LLLKSNQGLQSNQSSFPAMSGRGLPSSQLAQPVINYGSSRTEYAYSPTRSSYQQNVQMNAQFKQLSVAGQKTQPTFQFNKTLFESQMQFRMRAHGRHEEFNQFLGIKIALHAQAQSANQ